MGNVAKSSAIGRGPARMLGDGRPDPFRCWGTTPHPWFVETRDAPLSDDRGASCFFSWWVGGWGEGTCVTTGDRRKMHGRQRKKNKCWRIRGTHDWSFFVDKGSDGRSLRASAAPAPLLSRGTSRHGAPFDALPLEMRGGFLRLPDEALRGGSRVRRQAGHAALHLRGKSLAAREPGGAVASQAASDGGGSRAVVARTAAGEARGPSPLDPHQGVVEGRRELPSTPPPRRLRRPGKPQPARHSLSRGNSVESLEGPPAGPHDQAGRIVDG